MPDLSSMMQLLLSQAQPRPNLGQQQPVATMMGRAVSPQSMQGMTLADLLRRPATEGAEEGEPLAAGGVMIGGILGGKKAIKNILPSNLSDPLYGKILDALKTKNIKGAFSQAAKTFDAPMDAIPSVALHQLQKAVKNTRTGEVKFSSPGLYSSHPYSKYPDYMLHPNYIIRGFRDPKTGFFYPDTHPGLR